MICMRCIYEWSHAKNFQITVVDLISESNETEIPSTAASAAIDLTEEAVPEEAALEEAALEEETTHAVEEQAAVHPKIMPDGDTIIPINPKCFDYNRFGNRIKPTAAAKQKYRATMKIVAAIINETNT